jgi:hypothetical protein
VFTLTLTARSTHRGGPGPARILWRSGDDPQTADTALARIAEHWSVRIRRPGRMHWATLAGPLTVSVVTAHLPTPEQQHVRLWQPDETLGAVVVSTDTSTAAAVGALWHPFPTARHAALHQACSDADQQATRPGPALRRLATQLGTAVPAGWVPVDAGYWLATATPDLAAAALTWAVHRRVPVALAGQALSAAGFTTLDPATAEIVRGLAADWSSTAAELLSASRLLT